MNFEPLPAVSPLGGFFWTWVVPVALFGISFAATWLLYPDDYEDRVQCLKPYFYDEV